ncbi:hypothetical protein [Streptomyces sp. NPDC046759]|uniref:hypothetical protein n=1 Tax=Streptomyces sp. NPDC046759 TaxID=3155019 RepID=UPI0033D8E387
MCDGRIHLPVVPGTVVLGSVVVRHVVVRHVVVRHVVVRHVVVRHVVTRTDKRLARLRQWVGPPGTEGAFEPR